MNIILFCGKNSVVSARYAINYYRANTKNINVSVVCPSSIIPIFNVLNRTGIEFIADESIPGYGEVLDFLHSKTLIIRNHGRSPGWYMQQYLKLALAWNYDDAVFISDGDTIFSFDLINKLKNSPFLLTTKERINKYRDGLKIIGIDSPRTSFISNGGIFVPDTLRLLHQSPTEWFINSLSIILNEGRGVDFSEYQIQGAILANTYHSYSLKLYRRFDLIMNIDEFAEVAAVSLVSKALVKYDAIAFETLHGNSWIRKSCAHLFYKVGYSW